MRFTPLCSAESRVLGKPRADGFICIPIIQQTDSQPDRQTAGSVKIEALLQLLQWWRGGSEWRGGQRGGGRSQAGQGEPMNLVLLPLTAGTHDAQLPAELTSVPARVERTHTDAGGQPLLSFFPVCLFVWLVLVSQVLVLNLTVAQRVACVISSENTEKPKVSFSS